jgi:hypothetical protein
VIDKHRGGVLPQILDDLPLTSTMTARHFPSLANGVGKPISPMQEV